MGFKKVGNEDLSEYEIKWIVQVALEYSDFFKTLLVFGEGKFASLVLPFHTNCFPLYIFCLVLVFCLLHSTFNK